MARRREMVVVSRLYYVSLCRRQQFHEQFENFQTVAWQRQLDILGMSCGFDLNVICNNVQSEWVSVCERLHSHATVQLSRAAIVAQAAAAAAATNKHEMICLWFLLLITEFLLTGTLPLPLSSLFLVLSFTPTANATTCTLYLSCVFHSFLLTPQSFLTSSLQHTHHNGFDPIYDLTWSTTCRVRTVNIHGHAFGVDIVTAVVVGTITLLKLLWTELHTHTQLCERIEGFLRVRPMQHCIA